MAEPKKPTKAVQAVNSFRLSSKDAVARWITRGRTELTVEMIQRCGRPEDVGALAAMFAQAAGLKLVEPTVRTRLAPPGDCAHPRDREQKVMSAGGKSVMLVRCGECGERLR